MGHHMITRSKKQMVTRSMKNKKNSAPISKPVLNTRRKGRKKRMIPTRKPPCLPSEIISEILSWLPVDCLVRNKIVCKQWCEIMQDRSFMLKNMHRNRECSFHYREPYQENGETFQSFYTFDGLIMERSTDFNKYRIKNLALHRVFDMPTPPHKSEGMLPSYVHQGCYKVLSAYGCGKETNQCGGFEILTLGREETQSWRALDTSIFSDFNRNKERFWSFGIGRIAYFVRTSKLGSESYEVVSFDFENESFTTCVLARSCFPDSSKVYAFRWEDCLALAEIANYELHVWAEKKTVIPLKFLKKGPYMDHDLEPYRAIDGLIWFTGCLYLAYSIAKEKIVCNIPIMEVPTIRTSLVTFKGMRLE
ncbi:hypothetical protein P3X46_000182 [Hevea brasiliensis]|uniref:F-box domain-containing protein n=1 Tax=Hevea brasiliensis TaxID=3981 RepID=A0ABQ9N8H3_HEVBR|nr:hypothetical protein P3X46_000182 [Hevea brasiliensis]